MPYPTFAAGQRLTAAQLTDMQWQEVQQGSDQNSTSVTVANSSIVIPRVSGATYIVRLWARWSSTASAGFRCRWTGDGTITRNIIAIGSASTGSVSDQSAVQIRRPNFDTEITVNFIDTSAYNHYEELRVSGGTSANLVFQIGRNAASGTTTLAGTSYAAYLRIG